MLLILLEICHGKVISKVFRSVSISTIGGLDIFKVHTWLKQVNQNF